MNTLNRVWRAECEAVNLRNALDCFAVPTNGFNCHNLTVCHRKKDGLQDL